MRDLQRRQKVTQSEWKGRMLWKSKTVYTQFHFLPVCKTLHLQKSVLISPSPVCLTNLTVSWGSSPASFLLAFSLFIICFAHSFFFCPRFSSHILNHLSSEGDNWDAVLCRCGDQRPCQYGQNHLSGLAHENHKSWHVEIHLLFLVNALDLCSNGLQVHLFDVSAFSRFCQKMWSSYLIIVRTEQCC